MIYTTLLSIGIVGLVVLALLGGHGGHGARGGAHAAAGGRGGGGHAAGGRGPGGHHHTHASAGGHRGGGARGGRSGDFTALFWSLLSPLSLFSLCLGAGATGMFTRTLHWPAPFVALSAAAGAALFYGLVVRPLWSLVFKFASVPSGALEATVSQSAEAVTGFDKSGMGIVRVNVDGQLVRILAMLEQEDRSAGSIIKPGDSLIVTSVDEKANRCHVTRL